MYSSSPVHSHYRGVCLETPPHLPGLSKSHICYRHNNCLHTMIPLFKVYMSRSSQEYALRVLDSGYVGQGKEVDNFEEKLERFLRVKALALNSGTSALHLSFHMIGESLDIREKEVLTTPLTCTATNWAALANGFRLKWVDVNQNNLNVDLDDLESKLTEFTRVVMVVHWGGYPVDLVKLSEIQSRYFEKYGKTLHIVEDCAHAFGATLFGRSVGGFGNWGCFSFQAIKHLTCVDGGALVCPSEYEKKARLLRWYGIDRDTKRSDFRCEDDIPDWGFKFHMNDLNASIGIGNFSHISTILSSHKENAEYYHNRFSGKVRTMVWEKGFNSAHWLYTILVDDREGFMKKMFAKGVQVSQVHKRNDVHSCVQQYRRSLPVLDEMSKRLVCIPVGWWLSKRERELIADAVIESVE